MVGFLIVCSILTQVAILYILLIYLQRAHENSVQLKKAEERIEGHEVRLQSASELYGILEKNKHEARSEYNALLSTLEEAKGLEALQPIKAVGDLGEKGAIATDALERRLRTENRSSAIRVHVLEALARVNRQRFADLLVEVALKDPHPGIVAHAATLAGSLGIGTALKPLTETLHEAGKKAKDGHFEWTSAQRACAWSLMQLGEPRWYDDLAPDATGLFGYILATAPQVVKNGRFEEFHKQREWNDDVHSGILEGAIVQGDYDVILKVVARDHHEFSDLIMNDIQSEEWIIGTHTLLVVNRPWHMHWIRKSEFTDKRGVRRPAWVMLKIPAGKSALAVITAVEVEGVMEAAAVFGDKEVVVKIVTDSEEKDIKVIRQLNNLPYVRHTHTYRTISNESFNSHRQAEQHCGGLML